MNRQYSSTFGRWTTPDPYGGSYNWSNPQSLNRYAYVNGRPLGATDTNGLDPIDIYLYYNGASFANLGDSELLDALLGYAAPLAFGLDIFEFGKEKDLGWWDTGPQFHGNVAASQAGKTVPNAPQQDGFAGCGCLADQMGIFHSPQAQQTWNAAAGAVSPEGIAAWYGASAVGAVGALGMGAVGGATELTTLGLEAPAAASPGFGSAAFGTAMHAQFGDVLLEQTGTAAEDWIFAAPNGPGVDATYIGSENIGFDAAELKPYGYSMQSVGNQIGSYATQPGATSVWWYNANGIIGRAGMWLF